MHDRYEKFTINLHAVMGPGFMASTFHPLSLVPLSTGGECSGLYRRYYPWESKQKSTFPRLFVVLIPHFHLTLGYRYAVRSSWHILCIRTPTPI